MTDKQASKHANGVTSSLLELLVAAKNRKVSKTYLKWQYLEVFFPVHTNPFIMFYFDGGK